MRKQRRRSASDQPNGSGELKRLSELLNGLSSLTNEKDHDHYFLNRFVWSGEFFDSILALNVGCK